MSKQFEITYVNPHKPKRTVGEEHFSRSSAFYPVTQLEIGQTAPKGRYRTAGFKSIKRIA